LSLALSRAAPRAVDAERSIALWLLACCAMIFLMVVIGGVTRLTESGLSITEWHPISGVIPPLDAAQWTAEFERYKHIPQYRAIHADMTLAEFQRIFFWEYLHRLWGRLIGVVFAVPFLYLLARRRIPWRLAPRLALLFVLGGLQGALGWYMVKSGLADRIEVSQYRLAAHLAAAVAIYGAMLWVALDLLRPRPEAARDPRQEWLRLGLNAILALAAATLVAGAFVAGLRAGYVYNTFPLMNGRLVPAEYWQLSPWYLNWFENLAAVQFDHRLLAMATWAAIGAAWLFSRRLDLGRGRRRAMDALFALANLQVGLGIATLLLVVPLDLAVLHQAGAILLLTAALVARHALRAAPAARVDVAERLTL
jgi:cytochrome c oxidase assembly protein subunit 15